MQTWEKELRANPGKLRLIGRRHEGASVDVPVWTAEAGEYDRVGKPIIDESAGGWIHSIPESVDVLDVAGFTGWVDILPFFSWGDQAVSLFVEFKDGNVVRVLAGYGERIDIPCVEAGTFDRV
jgi:hypothetical protein